MFEQGNNVGRRKKQSSGGTIVGVFLFFLAFAIYNIFVSALGDGIKTASAEIKINEEKLATISETIASYDLARAEVDAAGLVELNDSLTKIPERMYQDRVILNMLKLAKSNDLEMNSLTFGKGSFGTIGTLRINSSFSGKYSDLKDFLDSVEKNERLLKIDSVTVQFGRDSILDAQKVNFSVSMEAFYQTN